MVRSINSANVNFGAAPQPTASEGYTMNPDPFAKPAANDSVEISSQETEKPKKKHTALKAVLITAASAVAVLGLSALAGRKARNNNEDVKGFGKLWEGFKGIFHGGEKTKPEAPTTPDTTPEVKSGDNVTKSTTPEKKAEVKDKSETGTPAAAEKAPEASNTTPAAQAENKPKPEAQPKLLSVSEKAELRAKLKDPKTPKEEKSKIAKQLYDDTNARKAFAREQKAVAEEIKLAEDKAKKAKSELDKIQKDASDYRKDRGLDTKAETPFDAELKQKQEAYESAKKAASDIRTKAEKKAEDVRRSPIKKTTEEAVNKYNELSKAVNEATAKCDAAKESLKTAKEERAKAQEAVNNAKKQDKASCKAALKAAKAKVKLAEEEFAKANESLTKANDDYAKLKAEHTAVVEHLEAKNAEDAK